MIVQRPFSVAACHLWCLRKGFCLLITWSPRSSPFHLSTTFYCSWVIEAIKAHSTRKRWNLVAFPWLCSLRMVVQETSGEINLGQISISPISSELSWYEWLSCYTYRLMWISNRILHRLKIAPSTLLHFILSLQLVIWLRVGVDPELLTLAQDLNLSGCTWPDLCLELGTTLLSRNLQNHSEPGMTRRLPTYLELAEFSSLREYYSKEKVYFINFNGTTSTESYLLLRPSIALEWVFVISSLSISQSTLLAGVQKFFVGISLRG